MINVTHTKTVYETINLSDAEARDVTRRYLRSLISPGQYLREKDGEMCLYRDDPDHRHGSISEEFVRLATPRDIQIVNTLKLI